jgi:putative ABC transport system permease protein
LARRQPGFTAAAILLLAAGIGAAAAVFALVNAVLLRDMPFRDPDRLMWMYNARTERDRAPLSIPDLDDYRRAARTLDGLAPFTNWTANLTGGGDPERLEGVRVAGNFFDLLGTRAALGRTLSGTDEIADARTAVITAGLWQRRFGADPAVVGSGILLNGARYIIVGVLPSEFVFPFRGAEVAVPLALRDDARRADRGANFLRVVARLKAGLSIAQAKADLDTTAHWLQQQFPIDDARKVGISLYPLHGEIVRDYTGLLWTLFGAVAILLLIGYGNLANLLMLRVAGRRSELALRVSLGASRTRIVQQLFLEAAVLAICGGAGGLIVASTAVSAWKTFGPADFPRMALVALDVRVVAFTGAAAVAAAVICGVVPGWSVTRNIAGALGSATRSLTGSRREGVIRRMFVVLQIGGSAMLLVCMGLVARSLARLEAVSPGFTADRALTVQLSLPPNRYATRDAVGAFYDALAGRLAALPSVRHAGAVSLLPLTGLLAAMDIEFPDRPAPPLDEVPQAHFRIASAGYFAAAGIAVLEGREFAERDTARAAPVAIVSEAFAARHWSGQSAVGKHLRIVLPPPSPNLEVVGVVRNVKQYGLDGSPTADLYVPIHQMPPGQVSLIAGRMYWVVRAEADGRVIAGDVREAIHTVDPDVATSSTRTLEDVLAASIGSRRTNVRLLELFGQVAMLLTVLGTYALAAFAAGMRRRELAIRAAFGASRRSLTQLMCRDELPWLVGGLIAGLGVAGVAAHTLGDLLFATSPWDPLVYTLVAGAMVSVTAVATWLPARQAALSDPSALLRI